MKYALNLAADGRVLSVTYDQFAPPDQPRVDSFPDGNLYEYRFVDGVFIHDPLPAAPDPIIPTAGERLTALEAQMNALMGGVSDVQ